MSHSLRYAVNCSILFTELPLLQRPAAAKAAGFDAVEFWWPFAVAAPTHAEVDHFVNAVQDAGVALVGLNFFAGDMAGGDRGLVSWPARSAEFRDNIPVVAAIGERLGCTAFNALYGNRVDDASAAEQDELAVENLTIAAQGVAGTVLVEPVSGSPRYPLLTAADVAAVIAQVSSGGVSSAGVPSAGVSSGGVSTAGGPTNLGMLADLYHLAVNGDDVDKAIATYTGTPGGIAHVQIADAPGRGAPGTGELPLDRQLADLENAGYRGWVSLEYKAPADNPDTTATFDWLPRERRSSAASAR